MLEPVIRERAAEILDSLPMDIDWVQIVSVELTKMTLATLFDSLGTIRGDNDLISIMAASPATRDMPFLEFLGNLLLLIVGGDDTTRNSISGSVLALNSYPNQYAMLREDPSLIARMVPEIVRWQTPLARMRRTALEDVELGGKRVGRVTRWSCGTSPATATRS